MSKLNPAAHIVKADPAFRRIVETSPPMEFRGEDGSAFESLLSAIVFQQLAGAAARAIHGRLVTALGGAPVAPESVLAADPEVAPDPRRHPPPVPEHGRLVLLARGRARAGRGRPGAGGHAGSQRRGSTITFPPEEGVISSSKTSGT